MKLVLLILIIVASSVYSRKFKGKKINCVPMDQKNGFIVTKFEVTVATDKYVVNVINSLY
jgi:hypothetical protein